MSDPNPQQTLRATTSAHTRQKSTALDAHPSTAPLVDWFHAHGGWLSPDVRIAHSAASGFHLRAVRPLTTPVIVRCPLKLTISHYNLDTRQQNVEHITSPLARYLGVLPNHVLSRLLLMEQVGQAEKALWAPYIACLPKPEDMTSALWFDESDMQWLAGTNLAQATASMLAKLTEEWEHAVHVLRQDDQLIPGWFDCNRYKWASTIFSSRSFTSAPIIGEPEGFPILFPVLDILNHSLDAQVEWDVRPQEDFTLKHLQPEAVRAGDEVFNNYFPKQNGEYLLAYGFALEHNPVEQFAIKMTIPPPMEEALEQVGLYDASMVPFAMLTSFLSNPHAEPHYLRTRGHPFGRYDNKVPFFRGIPPWIVHLHFIMVLRNLGVDPATLDKAHPPAAIVFEILLKLYEAIEMKSRPLPLREPATETSNVKQKYASIYRHGQAKIIHAIKDELRSVISKLQIDEQLPPNAPIIVSTTEALITLKSEFPDNFTKFEQALLEYYTITIVSWTAYGAQVAALEEASIPAELSVWKILLFVFAHVALTSPTLQVEDKLAFCWFRALLLRYPLPAADSIRDDQLPLDEDLLAEFALGEGNPVRQLNLRKDVQDMAIVGVDGEELGTRLVHWVCEVAERFAFQLPGGDRILMYLSTGEDDDKWAYDGRDADEDEFTKEGKAEVYMPQGWDEKNIVE